MTNDMFESIYGDLPTEDPRASARARAQATTEVAAPALTEEFVLDALRLVIDPEVGLDIVTLGLVYDLSIEDGVVSVVHTLTTPGCPMERVIADAIDAVLGAVKGVREVKRHLVFEPAWHPGMIREERW